MAYKWDVESNELLTSMYNNHSTDEEITKFFNVGKYAVAKQRCKLGLVQKKVAYHTRKEKTVKVVAECNNFIGYYKDKEGIDHLIVLGCDEDIATSTAKKLIHEKGLKNITILKPYKKLIQQTFMEVKL